MQKLINKNATDKEINYKQGRQQKDVRKHGHKANISIEYGICSTWKLTWVAGCGPCADDGRCVCLRRWWRSLRNFNVPGLQLIWRRLGMCHHRGGCRLISGAVAVRWGLRIGCNYFCCSCCSCCWVVSTCGRWRAVGWVAVIAGWRWRRRVACTLTAAGARRPSYESAGETKNNVRKIV